MMRSLNLRTKDHWGNAFVHALLVSLCLSIRSASILPFSCGCLNCGLEEYANAHIGQVEGVFAAWERFVEFLLDARSGIVYGSL